MAREAGGLVCTAEETPPLGAERGTGGTKPPKLKPIFAREAESGGSPHCQRKQGHNWCGGSEQLWSFAGSMRRTSRKTGIGNGALAMRAAIPPLTPERGLSDQPLSLSVFTRQAFTSHTVSLAPRPAVLFGRPGSKGTHTHTYQAIAGSSWVLRRYSSCPSPSHESLRQACSLLCNQTHTMAHPWLGHDAVSHIREEETRLG